MKKIVREAEARKVAVNQRFAPPLAVAVVDHLSVRGKRPPTSAVTFSASFAGPCVSLFFFFFFFINSQSRLKLARGYSCHCTW